MCTFGANTLTLRTVWGKYSMSEQALYRLLRFFCAKSERARAAASFLRIQVRIGISQWRHYDLGCRGEHRSSADGQWLSLHGLVSASGF